MLNYFHKNSIILFIHLFFNFLFIVYFIKFIDD